MENAKKICLVQLPKIVWGVAYDDVVFETVRYGLKYKHNVLVKKGFFDLSWYIKSVVSENIDEYWVQITQRSQIDMALSLNYYIGDKVKFFGDSYFINKLGLECANIDGFINDGFRNVIKNDNEKQRYAIFAYGKEYLSKELQEDIISKANDYNLHIEFVDEDIPNMSEFLDFTYFIAKRLNGSVTIRLMQKDFPNFCNYWENVIEKEPFMKYQVNKIHLRAICGYMERADFGALRILKRLGFSISLTPICFNLRDCIDNHAKIGRFCKDSGVSLDGWKRFETMEEVIRSGPEGIDDLDSLGLVLSTRTSKQMPGFISNSFLLSEFEIVKDVNRDKLRDLLTNLHVTSDLLKDAMGDHFAGIVARYVSRNDLKLKDIINNATAFVAMAAYGFIEETTEHEVRN